MATSNKLPLYLRWFGLFWGIVTLFWLPIEDVSNAYLIIMSVGWAGWLGLWAAWRDLLAQRRWRLGWLGVLAGLIVFPVAIGLILFKAGLHGHGFLDFSTYQIRRLAWLTPLWVVVGGLLGVAISRLAK